MMRVEFMALSAERAGQAPPPQAQHEPVYASARRN